ncbi:MAG TPA: aminopeptidase P family protein [Gemmatimonadaceae bacterium]
MADRRNARLAAVVDGFTNDVDGLLVSSLPNIRYLTGFSGSNALLFLSRGERLLITDFRYDTQVRAEVGDLAAIRIERVSLWDGLWAVLPTMQGLKVLGFEAAHVTHRDFQRLLESGARWQWRPQPHLVEDLRESKDADEVDLIRQAADMALRALGRTLQSVREGLTELQVAGILEHALRDEGSEGFPFPTIVASGPRAALPHARTSSRALARGDLVILDFGAEYRGYCSDITRTFVVGTASAEQREAHDVVRGANAAAQTGIRAGMTGQDADALARRYIERHGYGEAFGHGLGHGIGLEVHEAPRLSRTATGRLPVGAVVTIEPGIYRPEWGGIRIEDDVHLSADGPELLTDYPRELIEVP